MPMVRALALVLIAVALPAAGQLRTVEIRVSGLSCASCAGAVAKRFGRMRGITSANFDADKGMVSLALVETNTVTMETIRDILKGLGYTPEEATLTVGGTLSQGVLSMPHQQDAFTVSGNNEEGRVRVEGALAPGSKAIDARRVTRE